VCASTEAVLRVRRVLERSRRAPTADNSQPFRFRVDGLRVEVVHRGTDQPLEELAARLALGCLLEVVSLAAGAEGLASRISVASGSVAATVQFSEGGVADPLHVHIEGRATDRRRFSGGRLEDLRAVVDDEPVAVTSLDRRLRALVASSEGFTLRHPPTCRSVSQTLRFGQELRDRRTGVPFESFGLPVPSHVAVRTLLVRGADVLALAPLDRLLGPWIASRLRSSAGLVWAVARDEVGLVAAGRSMLRAWLKLNAAGWGVQPMSFSSLTLFAAATGRLPPDAPEPWRSRWRDDARWVGERLGLGAGHPCWMLRVGRSPRLPDALRTPRLPLSTYVTDHTSRSPTRSSDADRSSG